MPTEKVAEKQKRNNNSNYHQGPKNRSLMHTKEPRYTHETKVFALGGLGEIGKNTYCIEHDDEIIIIDAGVKFAEEGLPGIDYIIPDYSYLVKNQKKIKALLITHGHEDHIGGIPFLLQVVTVPFIYASPLASALIKRKLEEKRLTKAAKIIEIDDSSRVETKFFNIGFLEPITLFPNHWELSLILQMEELLQPVTLNLT